MMKGAAGGRSHADLHTGAVFRRASIVAPIVLLLLLLAFIAGCGTGEDEAASPPESLAALVGEPVGAEHAVELTSTPEGLAAVDGLGAVHDRRPTVTIIRGDEPDQEITLPGEPLANVSALSVDSSVYVLGIPCPDWDGSSFDSSAAWAGLCGGSTYRVVEVPLEGGEPKTITSSVPAAEDGGLYVKSAAHGRFLASLGGPAPTWVIVDARTGEVTQVSASGVNGQEIVCPIDDGWLRASAAYVDPPAAQGESRPLLDLVTVYELNPSSTTPAWKTLPETDADLASHVVLPAACTASGPLLLADVGGDHKPLAVRVEPREGSAVLSLSAHDEPLNSRSGLHLARVGSNAASAWIGPDREGGYYDVLLLDEASSGWTQMGTAAVPDVPLVQASAGGALVFLVPSETGLMELRLLGP